MKTSTIQRNKFVSFRKKRIWSIIKPSLSNKRHINGDEIILKNGNETITDSPVWLRCSTQII